MLVPCFVASVIGDLACRGFGIGHHPYVVGVVPDVTPALLIWTALAGGCFGMTSLIFAELTHMIQLAAQSVVTRPWLRPALGAPSAKAWHVFLHTN